MLWDSQWKTQDKNDQILWVPCDPLVLPPFWWIENSVAPTNLSMHLYICRPEVGTLWPQDSKQPPNTFVIFKSPLWLQLLKMMATIFCYPGTGNMVQWYLNSNSSPHQKMVHSNRIHSIQEKTTSINILGLINSVPFSLFRIYLFHISKLSISLKR